MAIRAEQLLEGLDGIAYMTEPAGRIVAIGSRNWNRFAAANGGEHLVDGAGVIGHNLFDFISGSDVCDQYRRGFAAIVSGRIESLRVSTRCDSPDVKRELMIIIRPVIQRERVSRILVQSLTLSEQMRPQLELFDFTRFRMLARSSRELPLLAMCSYCQSVRFPVGSSDADGEWISADDYYRRGGSSNVRISHGMCPACYDRQEAALAA